MAQIKWGWKKIAKGPGQPGRVRTQIKRQIEKKARQAAKRALRKELDG
jgi:hypothetical protein